MTLGSTPSGMTYLDICSGISAPSVAWKPLGFRPVMYSEIEDFPRRVLEARHDARDARRWELELSPEEEKVPLWGDFTALRVRHFRRLEIEIPDVLVGGTPCQAFSVAGLRKSLDDARGNLTLAFVRLANAIDNVRRRSGLAPLTIVWENVPGVLSVKDNAFGCFLGALVGADAPLMAPAGLKWTDAGMVAGPRRSAAWRTLDAQHFGLAQRRERVFVVASAGDPGYPAEVLFERASVHGNPPPRREARKDVAYDVVPSLTGSGRGVERAGESRGQDPVVPVYASMRLPEPGAGRPKYNGAVQQRVSGSQLQTDEASRMPNGRRDALVATAFEPIMMATGQANAEIGIGIGITLNCNHEAPIVTHSLRAEGFDASEDGTGRGIPLVPVSIQERAICENPNAGPDGAGFKQDGLAYTLEARTVPQAVAYRTAGDGAVYEEGDRTTPLDTNTDPSTNIVWGAFKPNQGAASRGIGYSENLSPTLEAAAGGNNKPAITDGMAVRRLMVIECDRLQGFPDGFTHIETGTRRKIEADEAEYLLSHGLSCEQIDGQWYTRIAADGPQYKALGNSMAVPVLRWIGQRILAGRRIAEVL